MIRRYWWQLTEQWSPNQSTPHFQDALVVLASDQSQTSTPNHLKEYLATSTTFFYELNLHGIAICVHSIHFSSHQNAMSTDVHDLNMFGKPQLVPVSRFLPKHESLKLKSRNGIVLPKVEKIVKHNNVGAWHFRRQVRSPGSASGLSPENVECRTAKVK